MSHIVTEGHKKGMKMKNEDENELYKLLSQGFIFYLKDGIINTEMAPRFGRLTLYYQDGKITHLEILETKK